MADRLALREELRTLFTRPLVLFRNPHTMISLIAVVTGAAAAAAAVLFREAIAVIQVLFYGFGDELVATGVALLPWWHVLAAPTVGGLAIGLFIHSFMPERRPQGVAEVIEASALRAGRMSGRAGLCAALASAASIGCGASVGREGPAVHLGATVASYLGRRWRLSRSQSRTVLGCGAAAAVAASFNAPIAGAFFALEVVIGHYALTAVAPIVVASVVGTVISRAYFGDVPAFIVPAYEIRSYLEVGAFALLGITSAIAAVAFMRLVPALQSLAVRLPVPTWGRPAVGGLLVGLIALAFPEILGVGYEAMDNALKEHYALSTLIVLALLKILATAISFATGFAGGVFSPSLFIGAMVGGAFGIVATLPYPELSSGHGAYTLVGMGAVSGAVLGAPISTMLIMFELTGDYRLTIAVMVAVVIASVITRSLHSPSYFSDQLNRRGINLSGGHEVGALTGLKVANFLRENPATVELSASLDEVRRKLAGASRGVLFVVDEHGALAGSLNWSALGERAFHGAADADFEVADLLLSDPPPVGVDDSLGKAIGLLSESGAPVLPVIDRARNGRLVGWIDESEVAWSYGRTLERLRAEEHGEG